jgi:hypothetical protein
MFDAQQDEESREDSRWPTEAGGERQRVEQVALTVSKKCSTPEVEEPYTAATDTGFHVRSFRGD